MMLIQIIFKNLIEFDHYNFKRFHSLRVIEKVDINDFNNLLILLISTLNNFNELNINNIERNDKKKEVFHKITKEELNEAVSILYEKIIEFTKKLNHESKNTNNSFKPEFSIYGSAKKSVKKSPVKKSPVKKSPVKKSPVKKSPVKKSPVNKSPVKKSPVNK